MRQKRKQLCAFGLGMVLVVSALALNSTTQANEELAPITTVTPILATAPVSDEIIYTSPDQVIEGFLSAIRKRDRAGVVDALTPSAHEHLGGANPRVIMNTLRLTRHALYDHDHYTLLEPLATNVSAGPEGEGSQIRRVQLFDRDGGVTLMIVRLVSTAGTWQIDGLTVIADTDQRGV